MARTPAWDDLDGIGNNFGQPRAGRWKVVLLSLGLIGAATFVLGYYLPLYRAHEALTAEHQALAAKAKSAAGALKVTKDELSTTKDRRDELESARHERETAEKARHSKLELVKASLASKLQRYTQKDQAAVTLSDGRLFVSLSESLVFGPKNADVSGRGKSVLCDIAKTTTQNPLRVSSVITGQADAAPELKDDFKTVWTHTSAHAAGAAQTLENSCGVNGSRLTAIGQGSTQPAGIPQDVSGKFPTRIDIEILP
jgi:chemotaxis protein MotB